MNETKLILLLPCRVGKRSQATSPKPLSDDKTSCRQSDRRSSLGGNDFGRVYTPAKIIPFPKRSDSITVMNKPTVSLLSELLTAKEAANLLRISPRWLRKLSREGKIPGFRIDPTDEKSEWRYSRKALLEHIDIETRRNGEQHEEKLTQQIIASRRLNTG